MARSFVLSTATRPTTRLPASTTTLRLLPEFNSLCGLLVRLATLKVPSNGLVVRSTGAVLTCRTATTTPWSRTLPSTATTLLLATTTKVTRLTGTRTSMEPTTPSSLATTVLPCHRSLPLVKSPRRVPVPAQATLLPRVAASLLLHPLQLLSLRLFLVFPVVVHASLAVMSLAALAHHQAAVDRLARRALLDLPILVPTLDPAPSLRDSRLAAVPTMATELLPAALSRSWPSLPQL